LVLALALSAEPLIAIYNQVSTQKHFLDFADNTAALLLNCNPQFLPGAPCLLAHVNRPCRVLPPNAQSASVRIKGKGDYLFEEVQFADSFGFADHARQSHREGIALALTFD
jgi:hypothetical protein